MKLYCFWRKCLKGFTMHHARRENIRLRDGKDRVTMVLCGNAAGYMTKAASINNAVNNPRALRRKNKALLPVFGLSNKKTWSGFISVLCLNYVNILRKRAFPLKFCWYAPGNPRLVTTAQVFLIPPNTISLIQSLDWGDYTRHSMEIIVQGMDEDHDKVIIMKICKKKNINNNN